MGYLIPSENLEDMLKLIRFSVYFDGILSKKSPFLSKK